MRLEIGDPTTVTLKQWGAHLLQLNPKALLPEPPIFEANWAEWAELISEADPSINEPTTYTNWRKWAKALYEQSNDII